MGDSSLGDRIKQAARSAANRVTTLLSATSGPSEGGQGLSYGWLMPTCTLDVEVSVGNGHSAELSVTVAGKTMGPAKDHLSIDAGATEPLIGQILNVVTTVTAGAASPTPPPPPLVTVTLFQKSGQAPGQQLVPETLPVKGTFDANNVCRLDFGILLK